MAFVDTKLAGGEKHRIPIISINELKKYTDFELIITTGEKQEKK